MRLIVISNTSDVENEIAIVEAMIMEGLESFHLRKPHYTTKDYENYLKRLSPKFRKKVVIHSRHQLCNKFHLKGVHISKNHANTPLRTAFRIWKMRFFNPELSISAAYKSLSKMVREKKKYNYVILSPIYNSISKKGKRGQIRISKIPESLVKTKNKVFASGGIDINRLEKLKEMGFEGVCILGSVWTAPDPLEAFREIKKKCDELE